jgi:xanthine dehydrogenase accessory factor
LLLFYIKKQSVSISGKGRRKVKLISTLAEMLSRGEEAVLVTVKESRGSAPAKAGARMLTGAAGRILGTVGGGVVEHECLKTAAEALAGKTGLVREFYYNGRDAENLGLICGGEIVVAFEYVTQEAAAALEREERERLAAEGRVYIFGGGHVAQALVPVLAAADFACVVLEDRAEFCRKELFPGAEEVTQIDNSSISDFITVTERDYLVLVTRGHKDDLLVLAQALQTPARFIGMIGSRRKTAAVFSSLLEQGRGEEELARVHAPIGLKIGAKTPAEIAVSIAAQLIQMRNST